MTAKFSSMLLLGFLVGCASREAPSGGHEAADREVARARTPDCLFEIDPSEARDYGLSCRKGFSYSSGDTEEALKMPEPYRGYVQHFMSEKPGGRYARYDRRLVDAWLQGDGAYVHRIIWGKGPARRVFVDVSHYPGDNHYGVIYEINGNQLTPVASIEDSEIVGCKVRPGPRRL